MEQRLVEMIVAHTDDTGQCRLPHSSQVSFDLRCKVIATAYGMTVEDLEAQIRRKALPPALGV